MKSPLRHLSLRTRAALVMVAVGLVAAACSSAPTLTGSAKAYAEAKDAFNRGNFDRTIDVTDKLAYSSTPDPYTERARVLRAVVLSGRVKAFKELANAYEEGTRKAKDHRLSAEYRRQRTDNLEYWSKLALALGEVVQQLTKGGSIAKELTLEAPYPSAEGPITVAQLARVVDGAAIPPEDEEAAAVAAQRKGVDDALAEAVGGDRSKARAALMAGPVKLNGIDFALFAAKQLEVAAEAFDRKHGQESTKFLALETAALEAVKAAQAQLQESPNADKEKEAKKLQDNIKKAMKTV